MKALTLTQPWASLVAWGEKEIETRGWTTAYRGPLAIHAAKGFPRWAIDLCFEAPFRDVLMRHGIARPADLPRGVVVCTARLSATGTIRMPRPDDYEATLIVSPPRRIQGQEFDFGNYEDGRYGWLLTDVQPLPEPIPARGALSLWEWQP